MHERSELQTDMARLKMAAQKAWGPFLQTHMWSHWLTLTTSTQWTTERLKKAFVDEYVRFATKTTPGGVPYFWVIEGGALGDRPHLHALLYGTATLSTARLEVAWRHGRATVDVYDPRRGAAHYLTKEITGPVLDYDSSRRLPPLQHNRSSEAPGDTNSH